MAGKSHVVLLQGGGSTQALQQRLRPLNLEVLEAENWDAARVLVEETIAPVPVAFAPVEWAESDPKAGIKLLRRAGPTTGMTFIVYGRPPEPSVRKPWRNAGATLGLWEPFDDGTIRFQVNRALGGNVDHHGRETPRVPTFLMARITVGGRKKDAIVYSLSEGGAYLETPRASMDGAKIEVEIRLPGEPVSLSARVLHANVPGNLQRPNLPLGMGVHFQNADAHASKRLREYVEHRLAQLEL